MSDLRVVLVLSPFQNAFFAELAGALVEALSVAGVDALSTTEPDQHTVADSDVFALLPPHEYVALEGDAILDPTVAARTIGISAEQPHQTFFERNLSTAARLGAVLDFSPRAVAAYRRYGVDAVHQPFGYVPSWDRFDQRADTADIPVLYLGNQMPRRLEVLAAHADALARHGAQLRISDNTEPNRGDSATFVTGAAKRELLGRTALLLNIHQSAERYFEWLRFADAAHCGTAVLTEVSDDSEPFVDGLHFESFAADELGRRLDEVVGSAVLADRAAAAYDQLRRRPLAERVGPLIEAGERLVADHGPPAALPARSRTLPIGRARQFATRTAAWRVPRRVAARRRLAGTTPTLIAPAGTIFVAGAPPITSAPLTSVVASGLDASGAPTLEGLWPWEPWRLLHGQHLGRVLLVDPELVAATNRWIAEDWVDEHPHVAVALFAAVHGVAGDHVATPLARLAVLADPTHAVPDHVATRCRQILADHGLDVGNAGER